MPVRRSASALAMMLFPVLWLSGQTPAAKPKTTAPSTVARVEEYILWLPDSSLVYKPGDRSLEITAAGAVISHGGGWERRQAKPYLYHLRHASWKRHFWQVNTRRREVRLVWDGTFGVKWETGALTAREDDGTREDLVVDTTGGDPDKAPEMLFIRFPAARLFFVPSTGAFRLAAGGATLSSGLEWQSVHLQDDLYQIRVDFWKNYFWKLSTGRLQAWRVHGSGVAFGRPGGLESALPLTMARSSTTFSQAMLRTVLKAAERQDLERLARMILTRQPDGRIIEASVEFARKYPDVDPESAVTEISKEIERDPAVAKEIKELEKKMEELRENRQQFETAFENYDQKTNQLFSILSTVLKNMKEAQSGLARNIG